MVNKVNKTKTTKSTIKTKKNKHSSLGHVGLNKIFGENLSTTIEDLKLTEKQAKNNNTNIQIKLIKPNPFQPRRIFDSKDTDELAASIKQHGLFQPIILKKISDNEYILITGERRLRAAKKAGLDMIPAMIKDLDEEKMREIALAENIQRVNLTAIEEGLAFKQLIKVLNITQDELAKRINKSRTYVTNAIRLLLLPSYIQDLVLTRAISMGHARTLIPLTKAGFSKQLKELTSIIVERNLSVREVEDLVKVTILNNKSKKRSTTQKFVWAGDNFAQEKLASRIEKKLNTKVKITNTSLRIHYKTIKQLNGILAKLHLIGND